MRKGLTVAVVTLTALGIAACGASSKDKPATASRACTAEDIEISGAAGEKPKVTIPKDCSAPAQMISKDLVAGTGAEVKAGSSMDTHYLLTTWSTNEEIDSSWNRGEPFPLTDVGNAPVIDGWNEGLPGMKEGGRRLLIIPADKGYGAGGQGPIKGGETLVFVVDAVKVS